MRDQVIQLVGHNVLVAGEEEFETATGKASPLEVRALAEAGEQISLDREFWENPTAAEQARSQGTVPLRSIADLGFSDLFDDEEIQSLLEALEEGRSDS
jgi:hypothetical protein